MIRLRQLATGVAMNWLAVFAGILSSFFLSPFVVHSLGDTGYGVWVLATSTVVYLGLLDLGLRGAVTHFLAKHHARADHELASRSFSTVFQVRILIGLAVIAATAVLAILITSMFRIPPEYHSAARWTVILVGLGLVVTLICGMYGAVLAGLNRFDLLSGITIVQTVVYAGGTVWLLRAGYGLIALSAWQTCTLITSHIAQVWYGRRLYPQLRLRFKRPDLVLLREIWTFSFYLLVISISGYLIYFTGNVITGAFISTAAVTMYSIAVRLVEYHRQISASLAQVFMPLTSSLHAQNDSTNIHRLLIHGTRVALLVSLPIQVVLFLRGSTFIGLWMGPEYGVISGHLLQILMLSNFFLTANGVSGNISFGLGKHKPYALWQSAEAAANVALTLWFVKIWGLGLSGVAWGVTVPNLVTQALVWPVYITRVVKLPLQRYLLQAWLRPALAVLPFALGCAWTDRYWQPARLDLFFLQIAAMLPLYAAGLAAVFHQDVLRQWRTPDSVLRRRILQPLLGKAGT